MDSVASMTFWSEKSKAIVSFNKSVALEKVFFLFFDEIELSLNVCLSETSCRNIDLSFNSIQILLSVFFHFIES